MAVNREQLKRLAQQIADITSDRRKPDLKIVPDTPTVRFDEAERVGIREQIQFLGRVYGLEWFIRQEMYGHLSLHELKDDELFHLMHAVGKAVHCVRENISFEDAGLIRANFED